MVSEDPQRVDYFARAARFIRLSLTVFLFALGGTLAIFWLRSHTTADRFHGRLRGRDSFLVASKQGRLTAVKFEWHGAANAWKWETRSHPVADELSFPVGDVSQYDKWFGFGTIQNPIYFVMPSTLTRPNGSTISLRGAATATLRGSGVMIPYWFPLLVTALTIAAVNAKRWRYRLRTLLIATTLFALLLAWWKLVQ